MLPAAPADPRSVLAEKPCSRRESPPIPAQPASAMTGRSRRRSRVRVPSLPFLLQRVGAHGPALRALLGYSLRSIFCVVPSYEISEGGLETRSSTQFADVWLYERSDLQRVVRDNISIVAALWGPAGVA
jgi:hypothetical protein